MFDTMGFLQEDNNVVSKVIALIQLFNSSSQQFYLLSVLVDFLLDVGRTQVEKERLSHLQPASRLLGSDDLER